MSLYNRHRRSMQVLRNRRYRILLLGEEAAGPITELSGALTVSQIGSKRGTTLGEIDPNDTTGIWDGGGPITELSVSSSGNLDIYGATFKETDHSYIEISFDGYGSNPIRVFSDYTNNYNRYRATGQSALYTYLAPYVGGSIDFTIETEASLDLLGASEHWLIPVQVNGATRGFRAQFFLGYFGRQKFTIPNDVVISDLYCLSGGSLILDVDFTPSPGDPGPTIEFEGYNWDDPLTLHDWDGVDFSIAGQTALYTWLGTKLNTLVKVRIIGPGA